MAAGTWNQGDLEKRVTKIDLENYPTIEFRDTSLISDGIFDVVEFPNRLTAGKNLIKLRANNSNILVKNSKIHIEILDSNGNPIYYEPLNYLEHDGTRVIAIYIYPNKTAPGIGTIYLAGRTKADLDTGVRIPFSKNWKDVNYINNPNILWSRTIAIAPENSKNGTEIIFTRPYPRATVRERVNRYFQPINLTDVAVARSGSGTVIISAIPSTTAPQVSTPPDVKEEKPNYEGAASANTPMGSVGHQVTVAPEIKETTSNNEPLKVESAEIVTISTFSRLETVGFALSSSMEGGTITIVNPNVDILQGNAALNPDEQVVPYSQLFQGDADHTSPATLTDTAFKLSGSYTFVIDKILSSTKANVFQTKGFKNTEENTFGAFSFTSFGVQSNYNIKDIKATSNFTCSYVEPFILSETQKSQSFAEIVLSNIEPATGDVHKIQTLYKPSGQFGDFIDAGTVEVEQVEILEDVTSYESIQSIGMVYNRIGFFTDLTDFNKYWETNNGSVTPEVALTPSYVPSVLLNGVQLTPDSTFDDSTNRFGYLHLKSEYKPEAFENTRYELTFNAVAENIDSTDDNVKYPRIDIFVSGSANSIEPNGEYINQYLVSNVTIPQNEFNLGTRISTVELLPGTSYDEVPILLYFKNLKEQNIDIYFVIRRGKWSFSNLSLKSDKQTGFSPNFTRINTRIPSEFLETPLTFKFRYFDIGNNKAQAETSVYPVTFYGDNLLIDGDNNLLNGSVYIGNTIGSGIELAGVNSGFIRSIGYEGFKSASRTDQPGGFMLYTGSVLPNAPDNYAGVGIEIVQDSSSFFKFDTTDGIDIRAKKFFVGTDKTQFVSGSGGNIEISSSNFHLQPDGGLVIGGNTVIKAALSADEIFVPSNTDADDARAYISGTGESRFVGDGNGNYVVDFSLAGAKISGFELSTAEIKDSSNNLRLKSSGQITGSNVLFTGGEIGGFTIDNDHIVDSGGNLQLTGSTGTIKAQAGTIGGFTLSSDKITGNNIVIDSAGSIQTADYASDLKGWKISADFNGFAEFENAKIRGTLATAVFEKETVNAVGGQLYVANSTALTASVAAPDGNYTPNDATMSVVNVSGFSPDEILSLKKVSSTGFSTEYVKVISASRNDEGSDTDLSGKLFLERGYGSSFPIGPSASLGDTPGGAQSYSGSQVIVSTGKIGTGYIRLNANPNNQATPYMDIVERTGSGVYDVELKVRLGDLKGLANSSYVFGNSDPGFGLATDNVFLQGGIIANTGSIAGIKMENSKLFIGPGTHGGSSTGFFVDNAGNFSLGDKLVWDGNNLTIAGSITITNPSDQGFVTPDQTGSITDGFVANDATSSLLTSGDTGSFLNASDTGSFLSADDTGSFLSAAQTSSLENPDTYAFGGSDGFTLGTHTVNTGLNMNSSFLGYFDGSTPKTFMSNSGDFYLGGEGGAFKWDESEGSLLVSGSNVTLFTPQFFLGSFGSQFISGSNENIEISSSGFHLTTEGNITASNALFSGYVESRAMRQGTVTINASNASQFLRHFKVVVSGGNIKVTDIFLDGSLGGPQVTHIILDIDAFSDPDDGDPSGTLVDLGTTNAAGDPISGAQSGELQLGSIRNIFPPTIKSAGGKAKITIDIATGKTVTMFIDKNSNAGMGKQFSQMVTHPTQRTVSYGSSDIRLKENIIYLRKSTLGIPIYTFNYIGRKEKYIGTMAQDLLKLGLSKAVSKDTNGYYLVNYNLIDVDMKQI